MVRGGAYLVYNRSFAKSCPFSHLVPFLRSTLPFLTPHELLPPFLPPVVQEQPGPFLPGTEVFQPQDLMAKIEICREWSIEAQDCHLTTQGAETGG